ncbi:extracellular solute-binding protein [Rhabdaerophilum calidifontis]|uniref:extracellular solute-binding protein n=1 Tax=Rhabdaerophilum calidifontis TaxID=2604328 RepID=UPI001FEA2172|nr:extracellular solute-binding protein [Rhabdaerophilum calidifontis]
MAEWNGPPRHARPAMTRRAALRFGAHIGVATILPRLPAAAQPAEPEFGPERHGMSIFGDLRYPPDFRHFDYVNPNAPKGGEIALQVGSTGGNQNFLTFDTLNIYSQKGNGAAGMGLIFDSLMAGSADEPDSLYGLVAKSVRASADGLRYRFALRPEARFHDGSPLRAEDVVFTLETLKGEKAYPTYRQLLRRVAEARALDPLTVEFRFEAGRSRELPLIVAGLPILSKAYYASRDFEAATLESPLGSGAYRVERIDQGRTIVFRRVEDYWAKDLPVSVGQGNFDRIRYEYFRDREAAFQAFTAGTFTFREEFTSIIWATRYDFPAARDGRVKREVVADGRPSGTQGWFINTRRPQFKDPRVREAIALCFDFEWTNKNLMYGLFKRTNSYFENSPLKAAGKPSPQELALLEPLRGKVPDEVFGEPYSAPVTDGSGQDRAVLRKAAQLLAEAGCRRGQDGKMRLPDGKPITIEFLEDDNALNRHTTGFVNGLRAIGIEANIRVIDPAQFQRRVQDFDFDLVMRRYAMSMTPGDSLKLIFGSEFANVPGARNLSGIADPAIDAILERIVAAGTREDLTIATRVLDRLLRAGRYWVSAWYSGDRRLAYWDLFGKPEPFPALASGTADSVAAGIWWYDAEKARKLGK